MLKQVFVRVNEIILDKPSNGLCKVFVQGLPHGDGAIAELEGNEKLTTRTQWNFCFSDKYSFSINLVLMQEIDGRSYSVGKLVLPLTWFMPDSVVNDYFPLTTLAGAPTPFYANLSVHVNQINAPPFQAPQGRLLIIPAWKPYVPNQQSYEQPYGQQTKPKSKHKVKRSSKQEQSQTNSTDELLDIIQTSAQSNHEQQPEQQIIQQEAPKVPEQTPGQQAKEIMQNYEQQMQQQSVQQQNRGFGYPQAPSMRMQYPSAPQMNPSPQRTPQSAYPQQPQQTIPQNSYPQPPQQLNQYPQPPIPEQRAAQTQPQKKEPEMFVPPNIPSDKPAPPPLAPAPKVLINTPIAPPKQKPAETPEIIDDMQLPQQKVSEEQQFVPQSSAPKPQYVQKTTNQEQQTGVIQNPISIFDENFLPEYPDE